jgi:hypothetical protein
MREKQKTKKQKNKTFLFFCIEDMNYLVVIELNRKKIRHDMGS